MTTATVTILFCDIVGSTQLRSEMGEVVADRFFKTTESRFRAIIDECGGRVLKGAGDGVMAMFNSASEAVAGAIALHRGNREVSRDVPLRVGIASGDVSWEGDDCFGMPVVVAARLETACQPGGILVAAIVRYLAGDRVNAEYEPVGALDLKGVPEPVDAFSVAWEVPDAEDTIQWAYPSTLPRRTDHPFVGRSAEFEALLDAWDGVGGGHNATVLLAGEAGAGKTRLATELARRCQRDDAIVLAGLCDSELSLPYQPWVMVLDHLISQFPTNVIDELKPALVDLVVLIPHLEKLVGGLPRSRRLDPEAERLRMFEAAAIVLEAAASIAPVLIILDDLHWAGSQTLDLLKFLVRTRPIARSLVVGTLRDTDDEVGGPLASTLADFRRVDAVSYHKVSGMTSDAVYELLDSMRAEGDLRSRAAAITERTRGNAFLVVELVRQSSSDAEAVPESIMDVVKARLQQLESDARHLANLVAIAGRLELAVLVEATRDREFDLARALGQLTKSDLVQELGGPRPAYQFAHALIRDAVAHGLSAVQRAGLHHSIAIAIEQVHTADRRQVLAELTRHFVAASSLAGWQKAAYYGRRAAFHARRTAAYEEAIDLIESSLEVTPQGTEECARLLIDMVDLFERCGRNPEAVRLAEEACETAEEVGDLVLQAKAGIELERSAHLANADLERSLPRLRRVLRSADSLPDDIRIQATASLGRASWLNGIAEGPAVTSEALEAARQLDDDNTLSHALEMACVVERDPQVALAQTRELEELTEDLGKIFQAMWAMTRQTDALLILGRLAEAERVLVRLRDAANRYRFTNYRYVSLVFSHTLALAAAAFELAEDATEAANTAEQVEFAGLEASGAYGLQMFMIRRAQGRLEEMRPVLQLIANAGSDSGVWRPGLVVAYAELGMVDEARTSLDDLLSDGFQSLPRDTLWPLSLMFLADATVALECLDSAPILLAELESLAGLTVRAGYTTNGGPADRCRAAMAELAGEARLADRCIADARDLATASASPLWLALTEATWAWLLDRRGDRAGASDHHKRASELAVRYQIGCITAAATVSSSSSPEPVEHLPDRLSAREVEVLAALADGCTNREIAERLFISPNTAANHVRAILQKTQAANRTAAAAYAFREGLVPRRDASC